MHSSLQLLMGCLWPKHSQECRLLLTMSVVQMVYLFAFQERIVIEPLMGN